VVEHPACRTQHTNIPKNANLLERERKSAEDDEKTYGNFVKKRIAGILVVIPVCLETTDAKETGNHPNT
jgi:hypothetical protein